MSTIDKNTWAYWYDVINTKERDDYQFYERQLEKDDIALEIACGTGRIYLDMLEEGYNVHGLDLSEDMLKMLKKNAEERNISIPKLFNSDVSNMDLNRSYDFIYYPFNSIAHINGDVNDQINTFQNIREHLNEDGKFGFDIYVMDFDSIVNYEKIKSKTFEHNDTKYKFEKWSKLVSKTEQRIKSKNRIINIDNRKIVWDTDHILSLYPKQQIELLLKSAGFSNYTIYDGFSGQPVSDESEQMGIIAEK